MILSGTLLQVHSTKSTVSHTLQLSDLHDITADIAEPRVVFISDLRADIHAVTSRVSKVEEKLRDQATHYQCSQDLLAQHPSKLRYINRRIEDLDNCGRRHNVRIRGLPETVSPDQLESAVLSIFNDLFERAADSFVEIQRFHRALRPRENASQPPCHLLLR